MKHMSFLGIVCVLSIASGFSYASFEDEKKDEQFVSMNVKPSTRKLESPKQISGSQETIKKPRNKKTTINKENIPPQRKCVSQETVQTVSLKEELPQAPLKSLSEKVREVQHDIQEGFQEASSDKVYQAFEAFEALKEVKTKWKSLGKKLGLHLNSLQKSWKDAVGGYLFHPSGIHTWEDHYSDRYKIKRKDTMWGLAIGARYNNPLSKIYLAKILREIREGCGTFSHPDFIYDFPEEAVETLEHSPATPETDYVLAKSYSESSFPGKNHDRKKAFELYERMNNLRGQFAILELKGCSRRDYPVSPGVDDYYALGEQGFGLAYVEAAKQEKVFEKKIEILQRAIEKGYAPALFNLGYRYDDLEDDDKARSYFQIAVNHGLVEGYIDLGVSYVGGHKFLEDLENVKELTEEEVKKGVDYFTLAGEAHHPEGWEHLIALNRALARVALHTKGEDAAEPYMAAIYEAMLRGMALGSINAYGAGEKFFAKGTWKENWERLIQFYGPSFEKESFCQKMEAFIKKKGSL